MTLNFELWLETELGDPIQVANRPTQNFCNISVTLTDGRHYAMNVWTFDFLQLARFPFPHEPIEGQKPATYLLPPDLFVDRLDRSTIELVIIELLKNDAMKPEWLCNS
jgi:hypothetical protein